MPKFTLKKAIKYACFIDDQHPIFTLGPQMNGERSTRTRTLNKALSADKEHWPHSGKAKLKTRQIQYACAQNGSQAKNKDKKYASAINKWNWQLKINWKWRGLISKMFLDKTRAKCL